MTAYPSSLPETAEPPATDGEEHHVLNGLVTDEPPLTVEVPPIALIEGEKIVRHPVDGSDVDWMFTGLKADEDGHTVIGYRTADGTEDGLPVTDPGQWVRVQSGQVLK